METTGPNEMEMRPTATDDYYTEDQEENEYDNDYNDEYDDAYYWTNDLKLKYFQIDY